MPTVIHRTFADRYMLRKIRAVSEANMRRNPALAALRILGLLQARCGVPSWAGFYTRSRGALRLRRFREDPLWEFPSSYRPERTLPDSPRHAEIRLLSDLRMADLGIPIVRDGEAEALLRIFLTEEEAGRAPAATLLAEAALTLEPLCAGRRRTGRRLPIPRATGS